LVEADKTLGHIQQAQATTFKRKYLNFESFATTNETITVSSLATIDNAYLAKASDGSAVTFTKAGNVLTVTSAGLTDEHIVGFAVGT